MTTTLPASRRVWRITIAAVVGVVLVVGAVEFLVRAVTAT